MSGYQETIVFEDQDLVVLNKPPGVVVNQAQANKAPALQEWYLTYLQSVAKTAQPDSIWPADWQAQVPADFASEFGSPEAIWAERGGIVHRLDKDTSGVLVLAKHPGALVHVLRQFRIRSVTKTYRCLIHGGLPLTQGLINAPLKRAQGDRRKFAVAVDGRQAVTHYRVLEKFTTLALLRRVSAILPSDSMPLELSQAELKTLRQHHDTYAQGFSLIECQPKTGRTHQIRVHLAHIQHPIVGDGLYVGKKRAHLDKIWCGRQFLHAQSLTFDHPRTGERLTFTAELPADLQSVLRCLE